MFMVDYGTFSAADGWLKTEDLTLCCLLNGDLTDSFAVSENLDNQSFTIQSDNSVKANALCNVSACKIDCGTVLSIQSQNNHESAVSVNVCESNIYIVSQYISDLVNITIYCITGIVVKICRYIKQILTDMKGRQNRFIVYTLCLLRL